VISKSSQALCKCNNTWTDLLFLFAAEAYNSILGFIKKAVHGNYSNYFERTSIFNFQDEGIQFMILLLK